MKVVAKSLTAISKNKKLQSYKLKLQIKWTWKLNAIKQKWC